MSLDMNRREALVFGAASVATLSLGAGAAPSDHGLEASLVATHDAALGNRLRNQILDTQSRWCGATPNQYGLHTPHSAADIVYHGVAAWYHPSSEWHKSPELLNRLKLAAGFLERSQSSEGNIDLITTNFNSPPDTAFVVQRVATAATLAQKHDDEEMLRVMRTFLQRAGNGLVYGGVHTPNHRWVVCAALAQLYDLFPRRRYVQRIDEWLAEGIDLDEEGQYIERSTTIYNGVINHALSVVALKLDRTELFDSVRTNLDAMAYLVHANGEVLTEISRRQDAGQRGSMRNHWFALRYLAIRDENGQYATMLKPLEPEHMELPAMMEYPEMGQSLPPQVPLPTNFEKHYPLSDITLIKRGRSSAAILHGRANRRLLVHHGEAVINGFRFASAFFGKGEFTPDTFDRREDGFYFRQQLVAHYFQPLGDEHDGPVTRDNWGMLRLRRERSEECVMRYEASIHEISKGLEIRVSATGTDNVPLAVEISLRPGGELHGGVPAPHVQHAYLLREGYAEYRVEDDVIRIGPGKAEHGYTQVRGASGKLPGTSLYFTGFTPFEHSFTLTMG